MFTPGQLKDVLERAMRGDLELQYHVGCHYDAANTPTDMKEAINWYGRAAEQGYAPAQRQLAYCFQHGRGVSKDMGMAAMWYGKAAAQGDADAQFILAGFHAHGKGNVEQDIVKAAELYSQAAEQGYKGAVNALFKLVGQAATEQPDDILEAMYAALARPATELPTVVFVPMFRKSL